MFEQRIEVILKVAERCNLNCSYCYFFNRGDDSYTRHAPIIAPSVVSELGRFLAEGVEALRLRFVQIDFHGGEPMLMSKVAFAAMCEELRRVLDPKVDLRLCIQTNATLVDDAWIELLARYRVNVSTSLDGPSIYHDRERVDFAGRGSHARTIAGIAQFREAVRAGRIPGFGVLCVIDPTNSARRTYRYFVDELGLDSMDFLLPLTTYDALPPHPAVAYGAFLIELFDEWAGDDNPRIQVRVLNSAVSLLLGGPSKVTGFGLDVAPAITVASDGSLGPDDTLRVCSSSHMDSTMSIRDSTLAEFLRSPFVRDLAQAQQQLSGTCQSCCWARVCGGGHLANRYGAEHQFDAPSLYCDGLKPFFAHVAAQLLRNGSLSQDRLAETLLAPINATSGSSLMGARST